MSNDNLICFKYTTSATHFCIFLIKLSIKPNILTDKMEEMHFLRCFPIYHYLINMPFPYLSVNSNTRFKSFQTISVLANVLVLERSLIYPVIQPLKFSLEILAHHATQFIDFNMSNF